MKLSLKERLVRYMLKRHTEWVPSGEIQRIVAQYTEYTPQNVGRRLRELENDGTLEVKYVDNHAHYRAKQKQTWQEHRKAALEMWNEHK